MSIIAFQAETVLGDACDRFKSLNIPQELNLKELKNLIKNLAKKLEYEDNYLEKELF